MFKRMHLLQHRTRSNIKWFKVMLGFNEFRTEFRVLNRCFSDVKRNEELLFSSQGSGMVIPSPLRMKQTIKTGFYDLIDGFTCIQTSCPTCPSAENQNKNDKKPGPSKVDKCLFINKTTGKSIIVPYHMTFNDSFKNLMSLFNCR